MGSGTSSTKGADKSKTPKATLEFSNRSPEQQLNPPRLVMETEVPLLVKKIFDEQNKAGAGALALANSAMEWTIDDSEQGDRFLNGLQALQTAAPYIALTTLGTATRDPDAAFCLVLIESHKNLLRSLPSITQDSRTSMLALMDAIRLALCFVDVLCGCLNTDDKNRQKLVPAIKLTEEKKIWISQVKDTRVRLKQLAPSLHKLGVPLLVLNSDLALLEMAIIALKDPNEKSKAVLAIGKAVFSAAKSVAQGSLDKNLLSNLATIGSMAIDKIKQMNAIRIYMSIHQLNQTKFSMLYRLGKLEIRNSVKEQEEMKQELRSLQAAIMTNPSVDLCSSFANLIAEVLMGRAQIQLHQSSIDEQSAEWRMGRYWKDAIEYRNLSLAQRCRKEAIGF
mmetsp:Transcript_29114/g.46858  ORF Transcript_29114/g.46858 Transcript_29114/m.46858 type:complete len:393 (+) Transcript_29114:3-1181(+)